MPLFKISHVNYSFKNKCRGPTYYLLPWTYRLLLAHLTIRKLIILEARYRETVARMGQSPGMAECKDGAGVQTTLLDAEQIPVALGPL